MATYNAYTKALNILEKRAQYWSNQADYDDKTEDEKAVCFARAGAYNSAGWILWYAMRDDWECLDQFDYNNSEEETDNGN